MSLPAVLLWKELQKRPGGFKFRREFPQSPLTLDFACLSARLIVEVDGQGHDMGDQPAIDQSRNNAMTERGFRTLRLAAKDVLKDMESCVNAIVAACREAGPPPPPLRGGPPPRFGEDIV
jgi:very-short-patch-repair endonuclease